MWRCILLQNIQVTRIQPNKKKKSSCIGPVLNINVQQWNPAKDLDSSNKIFLTMYNNLQEVCFQS